MTVRLRLTLLYGLLFLLAGAALLTINYALLRRNLPNQTVSTVNAQDVLARAERLLANPKLPDDQRAALKNVIAGGEAGVKKLANNPSELPGSLAKQLFADLPSTVRSDALHQLLVQSLIALAIMGVVSIGLGWLVAGRVLRRLDTITSTARQLSATNLSDRIAMKGPNDELKRLADTFDQMLDRLDSAFTSQQHFVANASHELRTPLTIMRTELDVVLDRPTATNDEMRAMGEVVRTTVDRCSRLVESLLTLATAEHGLEVMDIVDLADVARDAVDRRQSEVPAHHLDLTVDLAAARVLGETGLLSQAIGNLVDNAIVHNRADGWIRVSTSTANGHGCVVVSNTGDEIPPELVPHLFEPFRRVDERTRSGGGAGIGLSIVRAVATAHGGTATVEALPGGGLCVTLSVPTDLRSRASS